jgi:cyclase
MPRTFFALVLILVFATAGATAQNPQAKPAAQPAPEPMTVRPVAKDLYLVKGGAGANAAFFVTPKSVVVIDAKMTPEAAAEMLGEIAKVTPQPVRTLILTHSDGDHVNGLPGFPKPGAAPPYLKEDPMRPKRGRSRAATPRFLFPTLAILAHENVKRDLEKAAAETPAFKDYLPTLTYASGADLLGWDYDIDVRHFGPAHTDGDTCVLFPDLGVAFVGDLAFVGRDPLVHRQKGGTVFGYVKTLEALLAEKPAIKTFLSGHADPLTRADIESLKTSLADKLAKVKGMVAAGKSIEDVRKAFGIEAPPDPPGGRRRWLSFVETAYLELTTKK